MKKYEKRLKRYQKAKSWGADLITVVLNMEHIFYLVLKNWKKKKYIFTDINVDIVLEKNPQWEQLIEYVNNNNIIIINCFYKFYSFFFKNDENIISIVDLYIDKKKLIGAIVIPIYVRPIIYNNILEVYLFFLLIINFK